MKSITVNNFSEFHEAVQANSVQGSSFRGHKDRDGYKLKPSIGRYLKPFEDKGLSKDDLLSVEREVFELFEVESHPHLSYAPQSEWEWLVLAQHNGVPTRLMDWTHNALNALYFAVSDKFDGDSAVYILHYWDKCRFIRPRTEDEEVSPFDIEEVLVYLPRHIHSRVVNQKGIFTAHPDPTEEINKDWVTELVIPNAARLELKRNLYSYGVTPHSIYPDLGGLADWLITLKLDRIMAT